MENSHNDESLRPRLWYKLEGTRPVPATLEEADRLIGDATARRVACTEVAEGVEVSTVFMCLDHNYLGTGPPILFETMVFGGACDGDTLRCSTWGEAEQIHERMVEKVRRHELTTPK